jgi:hypothetical protein
MNSRVKSIPDPTTRGLISGGDAHTRVSAEFLKSLSPNVQGEVIGAYQGALRVVWEVCLAFNILGLFLIIFEKEIKLRTTVTSDHKLKENAKTADEESKRDSPIKKQEFMASQPPAQNGGVTSPKPDHAP